MLAAIKLFRELSPADIKGSVKIITVCDTAAFESRSVSFSPLDKNNLNRSFPGKAKGSYNGVLAAKIFDEIKGADYHMDLHCGEVLERSAPFAIYHRGRKGELNDRSHEMAYYYGLPNIMITETEGRWSDKGTCYASVYENIGIPSALFQTGGLGIASADSVNTHTEGIKMSCAASAPCAVMFSRWAGRRYLKIWRWCTPKAAAFTTGGSAWEIWSGAAR